MVGQQLEGGSKLLTYCAKKSELFTALLTVVTKKVNCNQLAPTITSYQNKKRKRGQYQNKQGNKRLRKTCMPY